MIQGMYALYDSVARVYMRPFFVANDGLAARAFAVGVSDEKTELGQHPGDFTLFKLGEFNDDKGSLLVYPQQLNLGKGIDHVRKIAPQSFRDEAHLQSGAEGGDTAEFVR